MTVRAGIVVTGTEVLSGIIRDENGPWLAERLRSHGVELADVVVVGDRRDDLLSAPRFLGGLDLVLTSGGLGPTADDLTAEVVAEFAGRALELDAALEGGSGRSSVRSAAAGPTSTRPRCAPGTRSRRWSRAGRPCSSRSAPLPAWSCRSTAGP